VDRPLDAEVDRDPTLLAFALIPDEADDDSEPTPLFVEERPVESEVSLLWAVLRPVEAELDSEPTKLVLVLMPDDADVEREPT
jgi:hypothetical protein